MTALQKSVIVLLAIMSGACEFYGTYTVWKSFRSTASVACDIREQLRADANDQMVEARDVMRGLSMRNSQNVADEVNKLRRTNRDFLGTIIDRLEWNQGTAWGLRAFFAGAIFGVLAAVLAVAW